LELKIKTKKKREKTTFIYNILPEGEKKMEELPDEVTLLVLAHIDPLRDTAAVSGTCRKWRRLMLDPHLWKGFHHRNFPTQLRAEDEKDEKDQESGAAGPRPWRHSYLEKARHLKRLLDNPPIGEGGNHGRVMAAALVGCLPLAEREVARLVAAHGGYPRLLSTLTYSPFGGKTTPTASVVCECLRRACLAGSLPLAQVCFFYLLLLNN